MPTTPCRARIFLKEKRAGVVRREPFTIRLRFATKAYVQKVVVGVDEAGQGDHSAPGNRLIVWTSRRLGADIGDPSVFQDYRGIGEFSAGIVHGGHEKTAIDQQAGH